MSSESSTLRPEPSSTVLAWRDPWWPQLTGTGRFDVATALSVTADGGLVVARYSESDGYLDGRLKANDGSSVLQRFNAAGVLESTFNVPARDSAYVGSALALAADGSVFVGGFTDEISDSLTNPPGAGSWDSFLTRFSPTGNVVWSLTLQSQGVRHDYLRDLVWAPSEAAEGDVFITGDTYGSLGHQALMGAGDAFIGRVSSDGVLQWVRHIGSAGEDYGHAIARSDDGHLIVAGGVGGPLGLEPFAGGSGDAFVARYSTDGIQEWVEVFGTSGLDRVIDVEVALDGSIYVAGVTSAAWSGQTSAGGLDVFVSKLSSSGERLWTRQWGSSGDDEVNALAIDREGKVIIGGRLAASGGGLTVAGSGDAFIRAYDEDGWVEWTQLISGSGTESVRDIALNPMSGALYVAGLATSGIASRTALGGGSDGFVTRVMGAAAGAPFSPVSSEQFAGHRYEVYTEKLSWQDAQAFARSRGGYLVSIGSEAEHDFVSRIAAGAQNDVDSLLGPAATHSWIGLYQVPGSAEPAGGWKWDSGETPGYLAWRAGAPAGGPGADYAHLTVSLTWPTAVHWSDAANTSASGFIVEIESPSPELDWRLEYAPAASRSGGLALAASSGNTVSVVGFVDPSGADPGNAWIVRVSDQGQSTWAVQLGGSGLDIAYGVAHRPSDGAIYVVGYTDTRGTAFQGQTGLGDIDGFISLVAADGSHGWSRLIGGAAYDSAEAVIAMADGSAIVSGGTFGSIYGLPAGGVSDGWIVRYDTSGNRVWAKGVATSGPDDLVGLAFEPGQGGFYATGRAGASLGGQAYSGGLSDGLLNRYDASGNLLWTRLLGGTGDDRLFGVAVAASGDVFVAGEVGSAIAPHAYAGGLSDIVVARYSSAGALRWARTFGSPGVDSGYAVTIDPSGVVYVAGTTDGTFAGWSADGGGYANVVLRLSADGDLLSAQVVESDGAWSSGGGPLGHRTYSDLVFTQGSGAGQGPALYHTGTNGRVGASDPADSVAFLTRYGFTEGQYLVGTSADDTINGGKGDDTLIGLAEDDLLIGDAGDDSIDGGSDDDALIGGSGQDLLIGGPGGDILVGEAGHDSISGGTGNDFLVYSFRTSAQGQQFAITATFNKGLGAYEGSQSDGLGGLDQVSGVEVAAILGSNLDDSLTGGAGQDFIAAFSGADTIEGGPGVDFVVYRYAPLGGVSVDLSMGTASGADGSDRILNVEAVQGSYDNDRLHGDARSNVLDGGPGDDTLIGGGGDDVFYFEGEAHYLEGQYLLEYLRAEHLLSVDLNRPEHDRIEDFGRGDRIEFGSTLRLSTGASGSLGRGEIAFVSMSGGAQVLVGHDSNPGADFTLSLPGVDPSRLQLSSDGQNLTLALPSSFTLVTSGSFDGHTYEVYSDRVTWQDAQAYARARGGYLVSINSAAENAFVAGLNPDQLSSWIGLYQVAGSSEPAGGWVWDSGETSTFRAWGLDEPNDFPAENFAHLLGAVPWRTDAQWNDSPNDYATGFIVERVSGAPLYKTGTEMSDSALTLTSAEKSYGLAGVRGLGGADSFNLDASGAYLGGPGVDTFRMSSTMSGTYTVAGSDQGQARSLVTDLVNDFNTLNLAPGAVVDLASRTVTGPEASEFDYVVNFSSIERIVGADAPSGHVISGMPDHASFTYSPSGSDQISVPLSLDRRWMGYTLNYWRGKFWSSGIDVSFDASGVGRVTSDAFPDAPGDTFERVTSIIGTPVSDLFDMRNFDVNQSGTRLNLVQVTAGDVVLGNGYTRLSIPNVYLQLQTGSSVAFPNFNRHLKIDLQEGSFETYVANPSTSMNAWGGSVKFRGVQGVHGSALDEVMLGDDQDNVFRPGDGNDYVDGRGGLDTLDIWSQYGPVRIDLARGVSFGGPGGETDVFRSVEIVRGTFFADFYDARGFGTAEAVNVGDSGAYNAFGPQAGDDVVLGNGQTHLIYELAMVPVEVNLAAGYGRARLESDRSYQDERNVGVDRLSGVNRVTGSIYADLLTGDAEANLFEGIGGNDTIDGGAGSDIAIFSGNRSDYVIRSLGAQGYEVEDTRAQQVRDTVTGSWSLRNGIDRLISIETLRFADVDVGTGTAATSAAPTYSISAGAGSVNEGGSVTFTIDTTNLAIGSAVQYTLIGLSQSDLASGAVTGSASVASAGANGRVTVTVSVRADQITEGLEQLRLAVGTTVSPRVDVQDTSIAPQPTVLEKAGATELGDTELTLTASDKSAGLGAVRGLGGPDVFLLDASGVYAGGAGPDGFTMTPSMAGNYIVAGSEVGQDPDKRIAPPIDDYDWLSLQAGATVDLTAGTISGAGVLGNYQVNFSGIDRIAGASVPSRHSISGLSSGLVYLPSGSDTVSQPLAVEQFWFGMTVSYERGPFNTAGITLTHDLDGRGCVVSSAYPSDEGDVLYRVAGVTGTAAADLFDMRNFDVNPHGSRLNWVAVTAGDVVLGNGQTRLSLPGISLNSNLSLLTSGGSPDFNRRLSVDLQKGSFEVYPWDSSSTASNANLNSSAGSVTFSGVEGLYGSAHDEVMLGDALDNFFRPGDGHDFVDGRGGLDTIDFNPHVGPVTIDLAGGTAAGGPASDVDQFRRIEKVAGSPFADMFDAREFGSALAINAGDAGAYNWFRPAGGDDVVLGNGQTHVSYERSLASVEVNLEEGFGRARLASDRLVTGELGIGEDRLSGVNRLTGTIYADLFTGDPTDNVFEGAGGNDTIVGGSGQDIAIFSGNRADYLVRSLGAQVYEVQDNRSAEIRNEQTGVWTLNNGTDRLSGIEVLRFADGDVGIDSVLASFGNHYYRTVNAGVSWQEARDLSWSSNYKGLQGYLVTITSATEQEFVSGLSLNAVNVGYDGASIWLGANDAGTEGQWQWVTGPESGTVFWAGTASGSAVGASYSNWRLTIPEPTGVSPNEDYAFANLNTASFGQGRWVDGVDSILNGYVVEYGGLPVSYTITPSATSVNEGSSITFTIDTVNVEWGSTIQYTLTGISQSDLASGSLAGTATVAANGVNGRTTVTVNIAADQVAEGIETLRLVVGGVTSAGVEVQDTSALAESAMDFKIGTVMRDFNLTLTASDKLGGISGVRGLGGDDSFQVDASGIYSGGGGSDWFVMNQTMVGAYTVLGAEIGATPPGRYEDSLLDNDGLLLLPGAAVDLSAGTVVGSSGAGNYRLDFSGIERINGSSTPSGHVVTGAWNNSLSYAPSGNDRIVQPLLIERSWFFDGVTYARSPFQSAGISVTHDEFGIGRVRSPAFPGAEGDTLERVGLINGTSVADTFDMRNFKVNASGGRTNLVSVTAGDVVYGNGQTGLILPGYPLSMSTNPSSTVSLPDFNRRVLIDLEVGTFEVYATPATPSTSLNAWAGAVTFSGVDRLIGSPQDEIMLGDGQDNYFRTGDGSDYVDGRGGLDWLDFNRQGPTRVYLAAGLAYGGTASDVDEFRRIEIAGGSRFGDLFDARGFGTAQAVNVGDAGSYNKFFTMGFNDVVLGNGQTHLSYVRSDIPVEVDLSAGIGRPRLEIDRLMVSDLGNGEDRISGVNRITGSYLADRFTGDHGDNLFEGRGGSDTIEGGAGRDVVILGGKRADFTVRSLGGQAFEVQDNRLAEIFDPEAGVWSLNNGTDRLNGIEVLRFTDGDMALLPSALPIQIRVASVSASTVGLELWIDANAPLENIDLTLSVEPSGSLQISNQITLDPSRFSAWLALLEPAPGAPGSYWLSAASPAPVQDETQFIRFGRVDAVRLSPEDDVLQVSVGGLVLNQNAIPGVFIFDIPLESTVTVSAVSDSISEGAAEADRKLVFDVNLDLASPTAQTVNWQLERSDGSSVSLDGDIEGAIQGTVSFAAGQMQARVEIAVKNDAAVELDEGFRLRLSSPSPGLRLPANSVSPVIMVIDDDRSVASVSMIGPARVAEGDSGLKSVIFQVALSQAATGPESVSWVLEGDGPSAADSADFGGTSMPSGVVTFIEGETVKQVEITIAGDSVSESDEGFRLRLSGASQRIQLSDSNKVVSATIGNDDGTPVSGKVYHWKNHSLLSEVSVTGAQTAQAGGTGAAPAFELRSAKLDASGDLVAEIWGSAPSGTQSFDLVLSVNDKGGLTFNPDPVTFAPGSGWMVVSNTSDVGTDYSRLSLAGVGTSPKSGLLKLGSLKLDLLAPTAQLDFVFEAGDLGSLQLVAYSSAVHTDRTGSDGVFDLGALPTGGYTIDAWKPAPVPSLTDRPISSIDALAALKMAVGLNPNADPDGAGPLTVPMVSPYQFIAADVVGGDGRVDGADALAILKMAVGRADAPERKWVFVDEGQDFWNEVASGGKGAFTTTRTSVAWDRETDWTLAGGDVRAEQPNLVGLLKGDVDGSWSAPAGSAKLPDSYFDALVSTNGDSMHLNQFGITTPVLLVLPPDPGLVLQ